MKSFVFRFILAVPCAVFIFAPAASARLLKAGEAEVSILDEKLSVDVKADATASYDHYQRVKILNEAGRISWGTRRMSYSPKNARFKVRRALTFAGEKSFEVDPRDIVDTEINATESGFDETRQIVVPFRQVVVGSEIVLETQSEIFRPVYAHQFADRFYIGDYDLTQKWQLEINSEAQLFFEVNDPASHLQVTKSEKTGHYHYLVKLKNPLVERPIEEIRSSIDERKLTWIQFSTTPKAIELVRPLAKLYEDILAQELPNSFRPILLLATKEKDAVRRLNIVLSFVADKIRYMGDWRAIDGAFIPRSLAMIADTRFGDCKDLATLTTKILRELGYDADVAWIYRGKTSPVVTEFGYMNFNHAVVSVVLDHRQLWLDPTNFQSFAQGVPEDIAERQALIMNPQKLEFRKTEFTPPEENQEITEEVASLNAERERVNRVSVRDTGQFTLALIGAELVSSKTQIEKAFIDAYVNASDLLDDHFESFSLKTRVVSPLEFHFRYRSVFRPTETSMGPAFDFSPPQVVRDIMNVEIKNRVSDLKLEVPSDAVNVFKFEKIKGVGKGLKNCRVDSPWLTYEFEIADDLSKVTRRLVVKKYNVRIDEVKSKAFELFQNQTRSCGINKYLVLDLPQ